MRRPALAACLFAVLSTATAYLGCSSTHSGTSDCTDGPRYAAGPQQGAMPAASLCQQQGGQCEYSSTPTNRACPPGTHAAPLSSALDDACNTGTYGGGGTCGGGPCGNVCPPGEGIALQRHCCLPGDEDGGSDASADADAAPSIGSCEGTACRAGCSCGILPYDGRPHCLCPDDQDAEAGSHTPNCGTIDCFAGCTCRNGTQSSCGCT